MFAFRSWEGEKGRAPYRVYQQPHLKCGDLPGEGPQNLPITSGPGKWSPFFSSPPSCSGLISLKVLKPRRRQSVACGYASPLLEPPSPFSPTSSILSELSPSGTTWDRHILCSLPGQGMLKTPRPGWIQQLNPQGGQGESGK